MLNPSMAHLPPIARFVELAHGVDFVPVHRELMSDSLSPVQAFARLDRGAAAGLFESVIGGEKVGRYSFVASDPFLLIEARGTNVAIRRRKPATAGKKQGVGDWTADNLTVANPLETLRTEVQAIRV